MPNRAIDYNSITEPLGQSMSMVAQHMLRQPQIRYRLDMEARKLASQQIVDQAQAGNYNAQARGHTAKAVGDEQRNGAFDRLNTGGGIAKLHGMIAGTMPFSAPEYDAAMSDFALAFGVSGRDAIELIRKGAQGAAAKSGVPARANAEATGDITSIANNDADITAQAARGYSLSPGARRYDAAGNLVVENPSAAAQREAEYETTTTDYPEIPAQEAVPATPAKSRWFGSDTPEIPGKPAVPGQPARKVTTRRKLGDFNHIINQVTPKETVPVMGDVRKRDEELMGTSKPQVAGKAQTAISTKAEFDALQPGTPFIWRYSDGNTKSGTKK